MQFGPIFPYILGKFGLHNSVDLKENSYIQNKKIIICWNISNLFHLSGEQV